MSNCAYKAMGLPACDTTPHMPACSRCGRGSDATSADVIAAIAPTIGADFGRDERVVLIGTPSSSGRRTDPIPEFATGRMLLTNMPACSNRPTRARLVSFPPTEMGRDVDRHTEHVQAITAPTPPTLREWLGDRVSELGHWADVLREQPVPAGLITGWRWRAQPDGGWVLHQVTGATHAQLLPEGVPLLPHETGPWADAILSALFTRHPDVKPDPRPAAYPWSPEDQHETIARDT